MNNKDQAIEDLIIDYRQDKLTFGELANVLFKKYKLIPVTSHAEQQLYETYPLYIYGEIHLYQLEKHPQLH